MAYERKTYDLFISDDLKTILEQIKSESVVADLLLKRRHQNGYDWIRSKESPNE